MITNRAEFSLTSPNHVEPYDIMHSLEPTDDEATDHCLNEFDKYCLDLIEYDILCKLDDGKPSNDSNTREFDRYNADVQKYEMYSIQTMSNLIIQSPCYLLFEFLDPYLQSFISPFIRNKLEIGFLSNGIDGKTLRFIDHESLNEIDIVDISDQNIILGAINQVYLIFSALPLYSEYTFDILHKYLKHNIVPQHHVFKQLKDIITTKQLNGEALMYINHSYLDAIGINRKMTQNAILDAIHQIFNVHTFAGYISTFPSLRAYQQLLIKNAIDLRTFKNNAHSDIFYSNIGIKHKYIINAFKRIFPDEYKCIVQCCKCNHNIIFDDAFAFESYWKDCFYRVKSDVLMLNSRLIYGEYMRIFCNNCVYTLNECIYSECTNYDIDKVCYTHPNCKDCKKRTFAQECEICFSYFCSDCLVNDNECKSCIKQNELNDLCDVLLETFYWRNIAEIIAHYAVGAIVPCCNNECNTEEIVFDNKLQFILKKDYKHQKIHYYEAEANTLLSVSIYNEPHIRMFCATCSETKMSCCVYCMEIDTNKYCGNHMICNQCKRVFDEMNATCAECHEWLCKSCRQFMEEFGGFYCERCVAKIEYKQTYKLLNALKLDVNEYVMEMITCFCVGYIFTCCNNEDKCDNSIVFDNLYQFKCRLDYNRDGIYHYIPLYSKPNKPTITMNHKAFRIFCSECTEFKLTSCLCNATMESGGTQCGNHPLCGICSVSIIDTLPETCVQCRIPLCSLCRAAYGHWYRRGYCQSCIHKHETNDTAGYISKSLQTVYVRVNIECVDYIAQVMANYAVGYIFKCCNDMCLREDIIFDDKASLKGKRDFENKTVSYYESRHCYKDRATVFINIFGGRLSKRYRIFCSECQQSLIECSVQLCTNKDIFKICSHHIICSQCLNVTKDLQTCVKCNKFVCKSCCISTEFANYICEKCVAMNEYNEYCTILSTVKYFNRTLIHIIVDYAIGYFFECGNRKHSCDKNIIMANRAQFLLKRNSNGQHIYYYEAIYSKKNKPTVSIEKKQYRMFCADCSSLTHRGRLRLCRSRNCNQMESGGTYCCNHPECIICARTILEPSFCKYCGDRVCSQCLCDVRGICEPCDMRILTDIIEKALSNGFNSRIAQIMASYSIGYVFNCCNSKDECTEQVVFDNCRQLYGCRDYQSRKITLVEPEYLLANRCTVSIIWSEGKARRFRLFCFKCTQSKLTRCRKCGRGGDVHSICGNHPICSNCNESVSHSGTVKCGTCHETCCQRCCYSIGFTNDIIYCKKCIKNADYNELYGPIYEVLDGLGLGFDLNIIGIMMDYCIGYGFECGNKQDECDNDVVFDNMCQFRVNMDIHGQNVYYYCSNLDTKYLNLQHVKQLKPINLMDNKPLRIFCNWCTQNRIERCVFCRNKDVNDKQTFGPVCVNHPICAKCNTFGAKACRGCDTYLCSKNCCIDIIGRAYCQGCAIRKEVQTLVESISHAPIWNLFDDQKDTVIQVIATYAAGFLARCFNKSCPNRIVINNIWDLKKKRDNDGREINWSYVSKRPKTRFNKKKRTITVSGRQIKMLCGRCCKNI